ncbi:MAG TPA: hypothetical protein VGH28_01280 [Polyangiaceae bacterium]|jgi:hypothetical protein
MAAKKTEKTEKKPAAAPKAHDTKLATFLSSKKIDPRRVISASHALETLQPEDRKIKLNRRNAKGEGSEGKPKEERKPRSGRAVTRRAMDAALSGKSVSGPTKNRIVRAVNHLLEQKKGEKIDLRALF